MFGRKKEITQKFIEKTDEQDNSSIKDESKKDKLDNSLQSKNADDNFIFYGSNNKFAKQIEIYATLKDPQEKIQKDNLVMILIDSTSSIEYLSLKICESFSQYPEYQGLEGLRAINLTKMNDEKSLPQEGKVEDLLRNGDIIYLDLVSNEIWIKVVMNMTSVINKHFKLIISMDVKIKNETSFKQLRYKLLKSGIMCYLDKRSKSEHHFHNVVSDFKIWTSVHGNVDENKLKNIDDMTVKQLFSFKSSVKLEIKFFPLEFILFQKLKILSIPKEIIKKNVSLQKFKQLKFRELLNNRKFIKEKKYIFNFFKNLFETKDALPKCYIYSIDEDINATNTSESNTGTRNNSEINVLDDLDNLKINSTNSKSLFNWSDLGRMSEAANSISEMVEDNEKMTLIILPPKEEKNDMLIKPTSQKKKRLYRNSIDRNINSIFSDLEFGIIKEENDDASSDDDIRKKSVDDNDADISLKPSNNLNFNLINEKDNENDSDDDIKYKLLKPQNTLNEKKKTNTKKTSCDYFDKFFEKEKFLDFLSGLYLINIYKGALERSTIPTFRKLKIDEKKISSVNKRRKKKKYVDKSIFYNTVFSVKRLNIELGVFSFCVLGILIFLSYLLSDTYL
jgi:hypothetical protein